MELTTTGMNAIYKKNYSINFKTYKNLLESMANIEIFFKLEKEV
jgi:hypothetical protein